MSKGQCITYCNVLAYFVEMALITLFYLGDVYTSNTPLSLEGKLINTVWIVILLLQGTFSMLPIFYSDDDFYEILCDKINLHFATIWVCITLGFFPMTTDNLSISFVSPILFFLLKLYSHTFVYRRIKYHDEGNAFVSRSEFFTLHITFSIIEAWISYLVLFSVFQVVLEHLETIEQKTLIEGDKILQGFGISAMTLIMWELTYNLTYYRDIIFSLFDWAIFGGIWYRNSKSDQPVEYILMSSMICFFISIGFTIITVVHSWESAFYLKYNSITEKLQHIENAMMKNNEEIALKDNYFLSKDNISLNSP